ncbi:uncharacterized protein LOC131952810 [Physella acuta]|uniref:uncharacterized protein LOC131952810 n=1 Tax=Physella acuta TaxID=109671 RepID=UPI0027DD31F1|nr:uncharacterized protein LOC131952810 [Physella acuta]XP_059171649.1 uncharacterized protein LOC131952810 [Physella acuta]XP_059171650.1 uncharacterized protein LOC131952810 [Physella acuta]XP_059171651.1 uncharacterized protein LOC131952810 [Physella acuta]
MDNSPHVWITSRRLRNPHFSRQLSDNLQVVGSNLTGTRRVKTATSRELFNTGQKPAFIDHYGHVIESSLNECVGKSSVSLSSANLSSATLPGVCSSGATVSGVATLPGSRVNSAHDTSPVNDAGTANPKDWRKNGHAHKLPDRSNTPTYCRPSMASIVESAWDGSDPARAGIYIKTGSARPQTAHSRYSRATTMSASSRTSGCPSAEPRDASAEAAVRRWRYRPLSAVYNTIKAKRYLEGRLRDIYLQRRAVSASPQSKDISPTGHLSRTPRAGYDGRQQSRHGISVLSALSRFRMVGYIAIYLRRLMLVIIANCNEKTMRSATELQWMAVYSEKQDDLLAFNKYLFSRDRVIAHVPDWALTILSLPPEQRSEQHCRRLHALLRGLKSFDKFTEEMQLSLCRAFTLEKVQEGRVVLKSGHVGVNFYFIYSGSVFVNYEDISLDGTPFMRTVAMLTRGDSFGELALLQDIRRTATISVREKCELLVVEKDVFASVCPKIFEKELAEKHAFLSTLDLFSPSFWSPEAIQSLCMNAQIQEYKINKVIVANSSLEDWIYACMEGKCQVIRCVSLDAEAKGPSKRKTGRMSSCRRRFFSCWLLLQNTSTRTRLWTMEI